MTLENFADQIQEGIIIEALLSIETIVRCPVLLMPILGAEQAGDGMTPKTHQAAEQVASGALKRLARAEQVLALGYECLQSF